MSDELSNGSSEIAALAQQVETARGKLPLQYDSALLEVLSEREIAAERELAEWIRAQRRKQRRREIEAELAAEQRDRKSAAVLRRTDEADARWHRRALAARRRVSSEDARLAQLYRRAEWSSRALIAVVVLGMVWAGVNVQHNLVPSGDMSDPLYWLSYGIEAMISIPIIIIMVAATTAARWGRELARGKVIFFEAALLGTTVALNTGPHLAAGDLARAAEYAIAPVMVGVVIWLHAWVSARYAVLIDGAPVVDRDAPMIRIDAEHVSARSSYLVHRDAPANGGRFRWDAGADASYLSGVNDTVAHRWTATDPTVCTETTGDRSAASTAANRPAATPADDANPSPIKRPTADSPINRHPTYQQTEGHSVENYHPNDGYPLAPANHADEVRHTSAASGRANGSSTNGHPVTAANGHAFPRPANGRAVEASGNGYARDLPLNGRSAAPNTNGHTTEIPTNGHASDFPVHRHAAPPNPNGNAHNQPVNGYTAAPNTDSRAAEPTANGHANDLPIHGHTAAPNTNRRAAESTVNGHANHFPIHGHITVPGTNGHANNPPIDGDTAAPNTNGRKRTPARNGGDALSVVSGPNAAPPSGDHTVSSVADYVFDLAADGAGRSADDSRTKPLPADTEAFTAPVTPSPVSPTDTVNNAGEPVAGGSEPQVAQQISIEDLHEELEFGARSAASSDDTAAKDPAAQPLPSSEHGGRTVERAHRAFDSARHARADITEPTHTPTAATTDAAAQANPNTTAPRAAKRGRSLSAEQSDRSADAESEQLAQEESPEPTRPHLRAEPIPILDEDDEDDELPAGTDEADTDDDEISAIARAITGRRLSNLPIEEVREILTLADQGGSTPAIANELGVSRSAVNRVLDSAIKVHRPYAITG